MRERAQTPTTALQPVAAYLCQHLFRDNPVRQLSCNVACRSHSAWGGAKGGYEQPTNPAAEISFRGQGLFQFPDSELVMGRSLVGCVNVACIY
jgi:hypothetical protein